MSLSGTLADITVTDLMQFVHLSGRSGTLHIERDGAAAHISFNRGRIVSAWCPSVSSVTDLLMAAGSLDADGLAHARALQAAEMPPPPLGRALIAAGVSADALREAITRKVEQTIFELVGWSRGQFRFVVDEIRGDQEVALAPGDVLPELDINTQMLLMEALRLFDERNHREGAPASAPALPAAEEAPAVVTSTASNEPPAPLRRVPVHVVARDVQLIRALHGALLGQAPVRQVRMIDAGLSAPGQEAPVVVLDMRDTVTIDGLRRLRSQRPRAIYVVIVEPGADPASFYEAGAAAILPPTPATIASCCATLLAARGARLTAPEEDLRSGLARLRRILGDLRSGLVSATMSLNLMTIVADSLERAVLFVVQRNLFVAVGAFGTRQDGEPLAASTRGIQVRPDPSSPFARCILDGRARVVDFATGGLPEVLTAAVDRPRGGEGVLFPVLGTHRIIALIYADNGRRMRPIDDVELVEIATSQAGLAFENELLRRQLNRPTDQAAR